MGLAEFNSFSEFCMCKDPKISVNSKIPLPFADCPLESFLRDSPGIAKSS